MKLSDKYLYPRLSKYIGLEGSKKIRAATTFVGIEIELEQIRVNNTPPRSTWKMATDGSLRENGKEFISIPIPAKFLEVELNRLFSSIKEYRVSSRCSVHTHLNVRDMSSEELLRFLMLYMVFEKSLYNFSGGRWDNNFCVPLKKYPALVETQFIYLKENIIYEKWFKYFGLNLSPIFGGESSKIGTVEFRHMEGTVDVNRILDWVNLIIGLKISSKIFTTEELEETIKTINTSSCYNELATKVFSFSKELIINQPTFKEDIESCVSVLKSCYFTKRKEVEIFIPYNERNS